jgi:hypothetical protein
MYKQNLSHQRKNQRFRLEGADSIDKFKPITSSRFVQDKANSRVAANIPRNPSIVTAAKFLLG